MSLLRMGRLGLVLGFPLLTSQGSAANLIFEDFEDSTVLYTVDHAETGDGSNDYWGRVNGTGGLTINSAHNGGYTSPPSGTGFFAGENMNANNDPGQDPNISGGESALRFSDIDIAGKTGLSFSAYFAADHDVSRWADSDNAIIRVEYSIDSGSAQNLFWLSHNTSSDRIRVDSDFDGEGDASGAELTLTFSQLANEVSIPGTGSSLDIIIHVKSNGGGEGIGIDNVTVAAVPEPIWFQAMGFAMVVVFVGVRRIRNREKVLGTDGARETGFEKGSASKDSFPAAAHPEKTICC